MAKRFNDGVINLASLRDKKEAEKKPAAYDPEAIAKTIPESFQANAEGVEGEVTITVLSMAIMPDVIYLILHDGNEEEPPFLMIGHHEDNAFTGDLLPATEEDLEEYNKLVTEYRKHEENEAINALEELRQKELQEMLEKAETEEEREQIRAMMN